ncbi:MAG: hypothetical protein GWO20_07165 [Candidatus Korarchaeota archaeon]|nr:hypothetical protein [Candidatus Korarchaeota archaeon]NIU83222.1 hypothetical protein [Candidatus Thorarchaeota archaeon]NIW13168.1 hypothetical protein [Candidatus Thorarchaeota archaeon]NIW51309.1 hypothetical protein [Candidatus Korarchaeota archaeon]
MVLAAEFGMRSFASTMLLRSFLELAIGTPYTVVSSTSYIIRGEPAFFYASYSIDLPILFSIFLMLVTLFYTIFSISVLMSTLKRRELIKIEEKIDQLEDDSQQQEMREDMDVKMKSMEFHRYNVRQFNEIKQMKTMPIDISIAFKLFSAADAQLISIFIKYSVPHVGRNKRQHSPEGAPRRTTRFHSPNRRCLFEYQFNA